MEKRFACYIIVMILAQFSFSSVAEDQEQLIDKSQVVYEVPEKYRILGKDVSFWHISFSPDGKSLLLSFNFQAILVEIEHKREMWSIEQRAKGLAFSPDGLLFAVGKTKGKIEIIGLKDQKVVSAFDEGKEDDVSLSFSPDGKTLASSRGNQSVKLWDWEKASILKQFEADIRLPIKTEYSLDGKYLVAHAISHAIVWELGSEKQNKFEHAYGFSFSPNSREIALTQVKGIKIFDLVANKERSNFARKVDETGNDILWTKDTRYLVITDFKNNIRICNSETGEEKALLKGHTAEVDHIALSPSGKELASCSEDGTVRLWNLEELTSNKAQESETKSSSDAEALK